MSGLEAVEAEATARGPIEVKLRGKTIKVLPAKQWPGTAIRDIRDQDFDAWASKCLDPKSYTAWAEMDPTVEEIEQVFTDFRSASGQDVGKSSASRRSSRSTARR